LPLNTRRKELFCEDFGSGSSEASDEACSCAFQYGTFSFGHKVVGCIREQFISKLTDRIKLEK
jgi:hypothetical protein